MNKVVCPNCKEEIEITQAISHKIEEEVFQKAKTEFDKKLEEQKTQIREITEKKIKDELEMQFKNSKNELDETKTQNKELRDQLLEITKQLRNLKQKDDERELEMQKKLSLERDRIQEEVLKIEREKSGIELSELKKQLDDTKNALEDAQRKAAQKSQQMQGEVFELELERILMENFPNDEITPVAKGVTGADIKHIVKSPKGMPCGVILWEIKRTKEWTDKWLDKLKEDIINQNANIPVIVSSVLPKEIKNGFGIKNGVWICESSVAIPLSILLRKNLLDVGYQKAVLANRGEKADLLYNYITGHEFQQQVQRIVETYRLMKDQIVRERVSFEKSWKQREAQADKIITSTANIIGSMQGKVGASMPTIKGLELEEDEENQQKLLDN